MVYKKGKYTQSENQSELQLMPLFLCVCEETGRHLYKLPAEAETDRDKVGDVNRMIYIEKERNKTHLIESYG